MTVETKDHQLLGSVKNALRLLQSFTLDTPEKKLTELASSLGLGKSTVSRLLSTLESEGLKRRMFAEYECSNSIGKTRKTF